MISRLLIVSLASVLVGCTSMNRGDNTQRQTASSGGAVYTGDGGDVPAEEASTETADYNHDSEGDVAYTKSPVRTATPDRSVLGGGVLIAYDILGNQEMVPAVGCRLKLHNAETGKDFFVAIQRDQESTYREIPAGRYFGTRLSCGARSIWNLDGLFASGFQVYSGKVSYVGKIAFEFSQNDLVDFKHATRAESHRAFEMAQNTFNDSPNFVSGFTGRRLSVDQASTSEDLEAFDIYAKGSAEPESTLKSLMGQLKTCANNESKSDPLRFGDLTYTAMYQQQRLQSLNKEDDQHALSADFTNCVENSLRAFTPPLANELEVRVRF